MPHSPSNRSEGNRDATIFRRTNVELVKLLTRLLHKMMYEGVLLAASWPHTAITVVGILIMFSDSHIAGAGMEMILATTVLRMLLKTEHITRGMMFEKTREISTSIGGTAITKVAPTDIDSSKIAVTDAVESTGIHVAYAIDPGFEKRVKLKLDLTVLPLMAVAFFFQFLDKNAINYAAVFRFKTDLHLTGNQFSWIVSIFYFGQLLSELFAGYLLSRFSVARFTGLAIVVWGGAEMLLSLPMNFSGMMACRFFLGLAEGAVPPAFVILTSNFWKRTEHPVRVAAWTSMQGVAHLGGSMLMYGIGKADTTIQNWRVMFLVCGACTLVVGLLFMVVMPKDPGVAWFLNLEERKIAVERLAVDQATRDHTSVSWNQAKEALVDPRSAWYFAVGLCLTFPSPILKYSSTMINGGGHDQFETMIRGLPTGALQFASIWTTAILCSLLPRRRCLVAVLHILIPLAGSFLLVVLPWDESAAASASVWLAGAVQAPATVALGLMASNVRGNTKKSVVNAIFFTAVSVGSIAGPHLWQEADAPRYRKGCITAITAWCCCIALFAIYFATGRRSNKLRDDEQAADLGRSGEAGGVQGHLRAVAADADFTEKQDQTFRYTL